MAFFGDSANNPMGQQSVQHNLMDLKKLHSEYRSTYKWHEFTPKQQPQDVVRNPPLASNADFPFMRKKKHPEFAYKSHEFFDMTLAPGFPGRGADAVDSKQERRKFRSEGTSAQRRAQSEGPGIRNPLFRDDGNDIRPVVAKGNSQLTTVPVHSTGSYKRDRSAPSKEIQDPMLFSSFPPPTLGDEPKKTRRQNGSRQAQMKESLSMGHILSANNNSSSAAKSERNKNGGFEAAAKAASSYEVNDTDTASDAPRREISSEYRKSFRPFSQYEYVDGRFIPSGFAASNNGSGNTGGSVKSSSAVAVTSANKAASLHGEPWYQEVVELRRQAQDYKCRGWGTETIASSPSTSEYYKNADLYEQAARRESLSALSLAFSTPRPTASISSKEDKAITEKASPTKSATQHHHQYRPARPRTAPPPVRGSSAKSSRSESAHPVTRDIHPAATAGSGGVRPPSAGPAQRGSRDHVDAGRAQKPSRARSPTKRPPSASTASSSVAPSPAPEPDMNGTAGKAAKPAVRQRPNDRDGGSVKTASSSATAAVSEPTVATASSTMSAVAAGSSAVSCHSMASSARRPFSRSSSKTGGGGGICGSRDTSRPPSAFENNIDYFREPVVKSPPEPTRVKSPEGMIRSPDPINWTVPLDTAKTFSVTQSVRDGESARNSPMSDHSSLFDSVSGTAINLGRGSYHHHPQRISSLAKEAILQPGLTKDSTLTKLAGSSSDSCRPFATEAHPNPSIPEAEENTSKDDSPMTTSMYHSNGSHLNGSATEDQAGTTAAPETSAVRQVPGTRLKCLDDPSFEFETAAAPAAPKKPSYRVLEDPFESGQNFGSASKSAGPYKVLEDPMSASIYDSSAAAPSLPASRPPAAEVLEGARERFDKFWGGKSNKESTGGDV